MRRVASGVGSWALIPALIPALYTWSNGPSPDPVFRPPVASGSIVYIKRGNVWVSDASGNVRRQLTSDGGYRSPSMADDGVIGALRDVGKHVEFVRLAPTGRRLGALSWSWPNRVRQAALSPDGRTFAYVYSAVCVNRWRGGTRTCWRLGFTPADRYEEQEATGTRESMDYAAITWLSNDRLVVSGGGNYFTVEIYVRGRGVDMTSPDRFENGEHQYKIFQAALTPDGQRLLAYHRRFRGYESDGVTEVLGPPEVGIYERAGAGGYELDITAERAGTPTGPTVSPDGRAWAFADGKGIWVHEFGGSHFIKLDSQGSEPAWGRYTLR